MQQKNRGKIDAVIPVFLATIFASGILALDAKEAYANDENPVSVSENVYLSSVDGANSSDSPLANVVDDAENRPFDPTTSVGVVKSWADESDPVDVTIKLLRNGEEIETAILNESNEWQHGWSGLSQQSDDGSTDYTYSAEEVVPTGYKQSNMRLVSGADLVGNVFAAYMFENSIESGVVSSDLSDGELSDSESDGEAVPSEPVASSDGGTSSPLVNTIIDKEPDRTCFSVDMTPVLSVSDDENIPSDSRMEYKTSQESLVETTVTQVAKTPSTRAIPVQAATLSSSNVPNLCATAIAKIADGCQLFVLAFVQMAILAFVIGSGARFCCI